MRPLHRAARCLLFRAVVDLLEHPRHGEDERGLERGQVGKQAGHAGGVPEYDPRLQAADLDDPRERGAPAAGNSSVDAPGVSKMAGSQPMNDVPHIREQVPVAELAPFRPSGGAGGVDDRRQVGRAARPCGAGPPCSPVTSAPAAARALSGSTGTGWPGHGQAATVAGGRRPRSSIPVPPRGAAASVFGGGLQVASGLPRSRARAPGVAQDPLDLLGPMDVS